MTKKHLILLNIFLINLGLRLWTLTLETSYWFDELLTLEISQKKWLEIITLSFHDTCPPLLYFLTKLWLIISQNNQIINRLLPLLISSLTFIAIYYLGKKIKLNFSIITSTLLLYSFSSIQIYYSTDFRMYSLFILLTVLSSLYLWKLSSKETSKTNWFIYLFLNTLLIYTHLFSFFFLFSQILFWFYHYRLKNKIFYLIHFLTLLFFSPWFFFWLQEKMNHSVTQGWFFHPPSLASWLDLWSNLIFINQLNIFFNLLLFISIIILIIWSFKDKKYLKSSIFLCFWIFTPLFLGLIFKINIVRYYLFITPALYFILALGWHNLPFANIYKKIILLILLIFLSLNIFIILPNFIKETRNWPTSLDKISALNLNSEIIILHFFTYEVPWQYYYSGPLPYQSFYPLPDSSQNIITRILKHGWKPFINDNNIDQINTQFSKYSTISIFSSNKFFKSLLYQYLLTQNWQLLDTFYLDQNYILTNWQKP